MGSFNPENLKLKQEHKNIKAGNIPSRRIKFPQLNRGEKFLKGPIPLKWLSLSSKLPGKAFQIGIALWYLSGLKKNHEVKLTNVVLAEFGVKKDAKRRGLEALEEAGLVSIKRRKNKNPIVTILNPVLEKIKYVQKCIQGKREPSNNYF
jgi:DNA-binding transcriptional ArsR family regulator